MVAKLKSAPVKNQHAFAAWVLAVVPRDCRAKITAKRTYHRREGFRGEDFTMHIALDRFGKRIETTSHDLATLAGWLREVALPTLYPAPTSTRAAAAIAAAAERHRTAHAAH